MRRGNCHLNCAGILDDLQYHMRHTVFKLTFNILSLFINVHHAHAICDHVSSMMWSRHFFCRPRQDLHSFRDGCKPRLEKSELEIFRDLACIRLESKFSIPIHLNFDPEPQLPFEIKQRTFMRRIA
jgi:hypothetical protein